MGSRVTAPGEQLGVQCFAQVHLSRGNFWSQVRLSNHQATTSPEEGEYLKKPLGNLRAWVTNNDVFLYHAINVLGHGQDIVALSRI